MFKYFIHPILIGKVRMDHLVDFLIVFDRIYLDENISISVVVWNAAALVMELFVDPDF